MPRLRLPRILGSKLARQGGADDPEAEVRRRRRDYFASAAAETPFLAVETDGQTYFVSTRDVGVGRAMFVSGRRGDQEALRQALMRLEALGHKLPAERVFVEVGANIGTTTVPALCRHGFARAVAIEASPDNLRVLRLNLVANGIDERVLVIAAAASDRPGELEFDTTSPQQGGHRVWRPTTLTEVKKRRAGSRSISNVPAITLDSLVANGTIDVASAALLWVDAPKHEAQVLLGASRLLEAGVPIVAAIRVANRRGDAERPWDVFPELKERILDELTASYTDLVVLNWENPLDETLPISELRSTLDSFQRTQDVLILRRPG